MSRQSEGLAYKCQCMHPTSRPVFKFFEEVTGLARIGLRIFGLTQAPQCL